MNRTNCLIRDGPGVENLDPVDRLLLVDYEFCCYLWRGCDIGGHFHHRTIDVTKLIEEEESSTKSSLTYPSEDERRFFIQKYLDEVRQLGTYQLDSAIDSVESVLIEAEFFGLLGNLFLLIWIINYHEQFIEKGIETIETLFESLGDEIDILEERKKRFLELKTRYGNNH